MYLHMYLYSRADTMVYVWLLFIYSISSTETRHTCILLHLLLLCQLGFKAEIQIIFRTVQAEETEVVILCRL